VLAASGGFPDMTDESMLQFFAYEPIRPHAIAINRAAAIGDQKILALYNMHLCCARAPGAAAPDAATFEDWRKTQP
jgi:hypothetical protein